MYCMVVRMTDFATLLQSGNAWLFVPSAVMLGALHGLEPGHSKTMMAAFIVAVRGTVVQAVLLGLAATLSHTAVVWAIALAGMYFGSQFNAASSEPYFQLISATLIVAVAIWMMWQTWADRNGHGPRDHEHDHDHDHVHRHQHSHDRHRDNDHSHPLSQFDHQAGRTEHEREHAEDIRKRFANTQVTTAQIVMFGLTGGLIPCPASITILLLCLQLKQFVLGATLVLCFSVGLALTMVTVGVAAALSVNRVSRHWPGFEAFARNAPYVSGALIMIVGIYTGYLGFVGLSGHAL